MTRWPPAAVPAIVGLAALLGGCAPVVMPAAPADERAPDFGPTLVVDLVNASAEEVALSFEYNSANAGGGGEGPVPACERVVMEFGDVAGAYEVMVAGTTVIDARVAPGMPTTGYLIVRVRVDRDGTASADGPPRWVAAPPAMVNGPLGNCG